jgi:hypothetical protein
MREKELRRRESNNKKFKERKKRRGDNSRRDKEKKKREDKNKQEIMHVFKVSLKKLNKIFLEGK